MVTLFSLTSRAGVRTWIAALIVFAAGIWAAPNLGGTHAVAVPVLVAIVAALVRAVQAYLTATSLVRYLGHPFGDWADSFVQGFLGSLLVTLPGVLYAPDLSTERSLIVAALVGALNAGVRAVQGALTTNETPASGIGLVEPRNGYSYAVPPDPPR